MKEYSEFEEHAYGNVSGVFLHVKNMHLQIKKTIWL
jgi:hypothetical protein